jgi:hypothetical protein
MKSRSLQRRLRVSPEQKRPLRKRKRDLLERLTHLAEKILKQEENIDTLRKERSQLNLSDNDSE